MNLQHIAPFWVQYASFFSYLHMHTLFKMYFKSSQEIQLCIQVYLNRLTTRKLELETRLETISLPYWQHFEIHLEQCERN